MPTTGPPSALASDSTTKGSGRSSTRRYDWTLTTIENPAAAASASTSGSALVMPSRPEVQGVVRAASVVTTSAAPAPRSTRLRAPATPELSRIPCRVMAAARPRPATIMPTWMTTSAVATTPYSALPSWRVTKGVTTALLRTGAAVPTV